MQSQKRQNDLCSFPRQTIHYHSNPSLCLSYQCQRSRCWTVLWRPTRPLRTRIKKNVLFIIGGWNAKIGSQEVPGVMGKLGLGIQKEAGQRLTEFCQENIWIIANTLLQQHEMTLHMDITRWSIPKSDWLYSLQPKMEKLHIVSKNKNGNWLWLRSWIPHCQIQT